MAKKAKSAPRKRVTRPRRKPADTQPWGLWALALILGVVALRLFVNALGWVPVHFDEGQYWAYGQELAWGHFSKPPLVGWVIYLTTGLGGDTTFALRIGAVASHAVIAGLVFLIARQMFDGKTGFWAAAGYTVAPGVTASSMIMSTDPVMMACWALALYAWVRAAEAKGWFWWAVLGAAIGLGMLAKYTALAFAAGALGYGLFSARKRDWAGTGIAVLAGLIVFAPNLMWQLTNSFHTVVHVAEDAAPGGSTFNLGKMAEFVGAQFGVIGPVWLIGIVLALLAMRRAETDWRMKMLGWQTGTLLIAITLVAFTTRAHPNWAAPAYVAGSILAARRFLTRSSDWALKVQAGIGAVAAVLLYGAALAYHAMPLDLPRGPDPFKKMRLGEPFCGPALAAMGEEGAEVLLSNDRRRLSECMFLGGFGFEGIAVWNPDLNPKNHHELVATLFPGDERVMILAVLSEEVAQQISSHFEDAREVESASFQTHDGRTFTYAIWVVQGFKGY